MAKTFLSKYRDVKILSPFLFKKSTTIWLTFCRSCFVFLFTLSITTDNLIYVNETQMRGDIKFEPQLILIIVSVHSDSKPLMLSVLYMYVNQLETKTLFYFYRSVNSNSPLSTRI